MIKSVLPLLTGLGFSLSVALSAQAGSLGSPAGEPVLSISGVIETTNVEDKLVLDMEMLSGLEKVTFETETIWTEGVQTFEGVSLKTLVDLMGVTEGLLLASAINDYTVEIPVTDAVEGGPIVAYLLNGAEMSVRDKGPLWIVYPYDSNSDYRSEVIYSRSIWQLDRIEAAR